MKSMMELMKKGKPVKEGPYKDAKMGLLKELQKVMSEEMAGDVAGLKKVTVAAPNQAGLEEGLEKAKEVVEGEESEEDSEDEEECMEEMPSQPMDIQEQIKELEMKLAELKAKVE